MKETYTLAAESKIKILEKRIELLKDTIMDLSLKFHESGNYEESHLVMQEINKALKKCEELE